MTKFALPYLINSNFFLSLSPHIHIQWKLDLRKLHYTKNTEYETEFEEISVRFNEKIFKIRKRKSKVPPDSDPSKLNQNKQKQWKKLEISKQR